MNMRRHKGMEIIKLDIKMVMKSYTFRQLLNEQYTSYREQMYSLV